MHIITLTLIKKNRVWIDCKTEKGYPCKLKIDDKSKDLELGEQNLVVKDISIRSKYGTDVRYELETEDASTIFLKCDDYNLYLIDNCKKLGGKWDAQEKVWVFPAFLKDKVDELEEIFCTEKIDVEITALEDISYTCYPVEFVGYVVAAARDRDSGASLGQNVGKLSGKIYSGGSQKNWTTNVQKGSVFRLTICKNVLEHFKDREFSYKIITEALIKYNIQPEKEETNE